MREWGRHRQDCGLLHDSPCTCGSPLFGLRPLQRVQDPEGFAASLTREQRIEWLRLAIGYEGSSVHEIALLIVDAMERAL